MRPCAHVACVVLSEVHRQGGRGSDGRLTPRRRPGAREPDGARCHHQPGVHRPARGRRAAGRHGAAPPDPRRLGDDPAVRGLAPGLVHQDQRAAGLPGPGGGPYQAGIPVVPGDQRPGGGNDPCRPGRPRLSDHRLRGGLPGDVPAAAGPAQPAPRQPARHRELLGLPLQAAPALEGSRRHRRLHGRHRQMRPAAEPHPQAAGWWVRAGQRPVHDGERGPGRGAAAAQAADRQGRFLRRLLRHLLRAGAHRPLREAAPLGDARRRLPGQREGSVLPADHPDREVRLRRLVSAQRRLPPRRTRLRVGAAERPGRVPASASRQGPDERSVRRQGHRTGDRGQAVRDGQ